MPINSIQILDPSQGKTSLLRNVKVEIGASDNDSAKVSSEVIKAQRVQPKQLLDGERDKPLLLSDRDKEKDSRGRAQLLQAHNDYVATNPTGGATDTRNTPATDIDGYEEDPWLPADDYVAPEEKNLDFLDGGFNEFKEPLSAEGEGILPNRSGEEDYDFEATKENAPTGGGEKLPWNAPRNY